MKIQLNFRRGYEYFLCSCRELNLQSSKVLPAKLLAMENYAQITCLRILILKLVICQTVDKSFCTKKSETLKCAQKIPIKTFVCLKSSGF